MPRCCPTKNNAPVLRLRTKRDIRSRHFTMSGLAVFATAGINAMSRLLSHVSSRENDYAHTKLTHDRRRIDGRRGAHLARSRARFGGRRSRADTQATKTSTIDLSARRRHLRRGDAFMLGAVASVFGAIAATAAAHRYRERYYYYGAPYDEGPYYYGGYAAPYAYGVPRHCRSGVSLSRRARKTRRPPRPSGAPSLRLIFAAAAAPRQLFINDPAPFINRFGVRIGYSPAHD